MKKYLGFSLLELLVTLAVASILLLMGVPAWQDLQKQHQIKITLQQLTSTIAFARNTAILSHHKIIICPNDHMHCGNDWQQGWLVIQQNKIMRIFPEIPQHTHLIWNDLRHTNKITLQPDGSTEGSNGSFYYGHYRLVINRGGRVKLENVK